MVFNATFNNILVTLYKNVYRGGQLYDVNVYIIKG